MKPVDLSARADRDRRDIETASLREWGPDQAERYMGDFAKALKRIGANPAIGPFFGKERPDLRRLRCGRHIIFYREQPGRVLVVRILHQRMEQGWRFTP